MNSRSDDEPFIMDEEEPADDGLLFDSDEEQTNNSSHFEDGNFLSPGLNEAQNARYENTTQDYASERSIPTDYSLCLEFPTLPVHSYEAPTSTYRPSRKLSRYIKSARHLIPFRKSDKSKARMPLDNAGFFSLMTYSWMTRFMRKSYNQGLHPDDIPPCAEEDTCNYSSQRLEFFWRDEIARHGIKHASLRTAVWRFAKTRIFLNMIFYLLSLTFGFLGPILVMRRLLQFCEESDAPWWRGAVWASAMITSELLRVFLFGVTWGTGYRTGIRVRSALTTLLYKKIMKIQNAAVISTGELTNMIANDGQRIYDGIVLGPMVIGGPYVAAVGAAYVITQLGPSALFGILTFVLFYPIQYGISTLIAFLRRRTITITDNRIKRTEEIITWIKIIKFYAWEKPFAKTVLETREREKELLEKAAIIQSFGVALAPSIPVIAIIVTFLCYVASGNELSPSVAFTVVTVYYSLRGSLSMAQWSSDSIMTFLVSLSRFQKFLTQDDRKQYFRHPLDTTVAIAVSDGCFAWQQRCSNDPVKEQRKNKEDVYKQETLVTPLTTALRDVNILIRKGELVGICGAIGSGKTSLINTLLGQLSIEKGQISIDGSFAYVSQEPWIINCSVKENILCGEVFDPRRFYNVVHACALGQDINLFPAGDETEIGERGINLSGGQRQRISMARALYANKDIYLLDDPFSALDNEVSQHIFENCIRGALKNKTVLFVTHQLQYLSRCDNVVFLDRGQVIAQGMHSALFASNSKYRKFNEAAYDAGACSLKKPYQLIGRAQRNPDNTMKDESYCTTEIRKKDENSGNLIPEETHNSGTIPWSIYLSYIQYAGGILATCVVLLFFVINVSSIALSAWWLAHWLNSGVRYINKTVGNETEAFRSIQAHPDILFYEVIYGTFVILIIFSSLIRSFLFMKASLRASNSLHNQLFLKILKSSMSFFDTTPIGRLLNLVSRDLDELDGRLPSTAESVLQNILLIIITLTLIVMVLPWFAIPFMAFAFIFIFFSRIFRTAARDLKRMENTSRSPIFSHISASLSGLNTIHAFSKENEFTSKFMALYDENTMDFFLFQCSMRWLAVRLDLISVCIVGVVASLVVVFHNWVPAAFAGLALAYSNQLTGMLQYTVRLVTEAESRFLSVQRIHSCIERCELESTPFNGDNKEARDWLRDGSIQFVNVKMRYRPKLPLTLKGITFDIEAREKIGVVGRTGSGKSSIATTMFRLVDLLSGEIRISNVNIAEISLEDLRSNLSIIPQDPVLFIGTIRYNLDPFFEKSDTEIWDALERIGMKESVAALSHNLDSIIDGNCGLFSVGERQLLCMARVLLRNTKIILLDEATASIDSNTAAVIQKTLSSVFDECTVITIAHRMSTVLSCDKVIVLSDGKVVEFDKPSALIAKKDSAFSKMLSFYEESQEGIIDLVNNK